MKSSLAYSPDLRRLDSFIHLDELLPELLSHILVSVFLSPDLKNEFPKLFCVCKRWIQILDCPNVHKAIEENHDKWYRNHVGNNLRLFDKSIFPTVTFADCRVGNAAPVGLLHSGSIIKELGRIDTSNGVYCVTANGCCRFKNQNEEIYLEPFDLTTTGGLYTPKGNTPVPIYIERLLQFHGNHKFREYYTNVAFPGTLFQVKSEDNYAVEEEYLLLNRDYCNDEDDTELWIKKKDFKLEKVYAFFFDSIKKHYRYVLMEEEVEKKEEEKMEEKCEIQIENASLLSTGNILDLDEHINEELRQEVIQGPF